jgi:catechol 2,3-dioxygenase-like lactoylglutathione lyase family enzyme
MKGDSSMPTQGITGFDPSALYQVGIVVKSIDETVKFYTEIFGIGPFEIIEKDFSNATYYGKKAGYRGKRAFAQLGPLTLELIELIDGKTVHEDFLKEKGEGIHHLGFAVKDLKKCEEEAEKLGLKVIQGIKREDGSGFAYLDSDRIGGAMFELVQRPAQKP